MWREMDVSSFKRVRTVWWTDQVSELESNREPFMVPLGHGLSMVIGGRTKEWRSIAPGLLSLVPFLCREVNSLSKDSGEWEMAGHSPLSREGNHEGFNYNPCGGGHVVGGLGKEAEEVQSPRGGGENPRERWFNLENLQVERCSLLRLERELDTSLLIEHGGV